MAQHRPPRRQRGRKAVPASSGTDEVFVMDGAVNTMRSRLRADSTMKELQSTQKIAELREVLGDTAIMRTARTVTGKSPTAGTIRRWVREDRVPNQALAEALDRHGFVQAQGGVDAVAELLGRSPSSVRKWMNMRQDSFRGDANDKLWLAQQRQREARRQRYIRQAMIKAGVMTPSGQILEPKVHMRATVEILKPGPDGYTRTLNRNFTFDPRDPKSALAPALAEELAVAWALGEVQDVVAILERHMTEEYSDFGEGHYTNNEGFHILSVDSMDITWQQPRG